MKRIMIIWRPPSLSELTPMVYNTGLTHLGSEASIYIRLPTKQRWKSYEILDRVSNEMTTAE